MKIFVICFSAILVLNVHSKSINLDELQRMVEESIQQTRGADNSSSSESIEVPTDYHKELRAIETESDLFEDDDDEELQLRETAAANNVVTHVDYMCMKWNKKEQVHVKEASLYAHNYFRKFHKARPLTWSNDLAKQAEEYSAKMAESGKFEHSLGAGYVYGENLGMHAVSTSPVVFSPVTMIIDMYKEIQDYHFGEDNDLGATGHFSQIVWRGTKELGCGLSTSTKNNKDTTYLTCLYKPGGNIRGKYTQNVKEPSKEPDASPQTAEPTGGCDFWDNCSKLLKNGKKKDKYCGDLQAFCWNSCKNFIK